MLFSISTISPTLRSMLIVTVVPLIEYCPLMYCAESSRYWLLTITATGAAQDAGSSNVLDAVSLTI
jgi:hypothetical protein